jgi:hypothetical protein
LPEGVVHPALVAHPDGLRKTPDQRLPNVVVDHHNLQVTYPEQPSLPHGLPAKPKKANNPLVIGLAASAVALLVGCCGGVAIGQNMDGSDPKPAAAAAVPVATPTSTVPTAAPSTPATSSAPTVPPVTSPTSVAPATVVMPNVVGQNAAVAADQLRKLGLTDVQYGSQDENDTVVLLASNWTVTKQSTKAGSKVPTDTLIVLTCTKER